MSPIGWLVLIPAALWAGGELVVWIREGKHRDWIFIPVATVIAIAIYDARVYDTSIMAVFINLIALAFVAALGAIATWLGIAWWDHIHRRIRY